MFGPVPILRQMRRGNSLAAFPIEIDRFKLVDSDHFRKD